MTRAYKDLPEAALALVAYWHDAREGTAIPSKAAMDPLKLRRWIGDVSIMELHEGKKRFFVRLHGSRVAEYIGEGFERTYLEDRIPEAAHEIAFYPYQKTIETKRPTYSIVMPGMLDGAFASFERLILPFSTSTHDKPGRFLVWVAPSQRDTIECDSVYGMGLSERAALQDAEDAVSMVVFDDTVIADLFATA